jgi:hypothetical protein
LEEMIVVVFLEGSVVTICFRKGNAITLLEEIVIIARSVQMVGIGARQVEWWHDKQRCPSEELGQKAAKAPDVNPVIKTGLEYDLGGAQPICDDWCCRRVIGEERCLISGLLTRDSTSGTYWQQGQRASAQQELYDPRTP